MKNEAISSLFRGETVYKGHAARALQNGCRQRRETNVPRYNRPPPSVSFTHPQPTPPSLDFGGSDWTSYGWSVPSAWPRRSGRSSGEPPALAPNAGPQPAGDESSGGSLAELPALLASRPNPPKTQSESFHSPTPPPPPPPPPAPPPPLAGGRWPHSLRQIRPLNSCPLSRQDGARASGG